MTRLPRIRPPGIRRPRAVVPGLILTVAAALALIALAAFVIRATGLLS